MLRHAGFLMLLLWVCAEACSPKHTGEIKESPLPGRDLAAQYCSRCHLPVSPTVLPKSIWKTKVLPMMGFRLGIHDGAAPPDSLFEQGKTRLLVEKANIYPIKPIINRKDWEKIVKYYLDNAPDSIPPPVKKVPIKPDLPHFTYHKPQFSIQPSLCVMVKIIPQKHELVFSDGKKNVNSLAVLDSRLRKKYSIFLDRTPIDFQYLHDTIYLTSVGKKVFPSDASLGMVEKIYSTKPGETPNRSTVLLNKLERPVQATYADLNGDGRIDILVCEFGHLLGRLAWYENLGNGQFTIHYLSREPGASIARIKDVDGDGRPDIIALMAQAEEGIFLFKNSPAGFLKGQPLLRFSPLAGSTYFDLVDFNNDGHLDIIYTSGDNGDWSTVLKSFHGIYIYLNDGTFHFHKAWFYQMNGAYKAIARDFDLDGDLDIAAISFFPDYARYPEESFVYLENNGGLNFTAHTFPQVNDGRWMVMDANDIDGDGDIDIALGSFVSFKPEGDTTRMYERWVKEGPSVVLLENTIR